MLFQAVVIFLPILNFFKFHVKGERSIKSLLMVSSRPQALDINMYILYTFKVIGFSTKFRVSATIFNIACYSIINVLNNRVYGMYCNIITVHNKDTHRLWGYGSVGQLLNIVLVTLRRAGIEWLPGHILVKSCILGEVDKVIY